MSGFGRWVSSWLPGPVTGRLAGVRERVTGLLYRDRESADLDEELRFHLEMEADRLERKEGLEPWEARRRAAVSFGGVDRTKEEVREARGLGWLTGWWLDVKLGLRMLVKYPALTVLGSLSMAFAIFTGAASFEVISQVVRPTLPLPDGDRIVAIQLWDAATTRVESRAVFDLEVWRGELEAVEELGAYGNLRRNLVAPDGRVESVTVAAMDAEGFRVAGVAPLIGRALEAGDERADAEPVMVLGHDLWLTRFGGDRGVIGATVRLGNTPTTVVGVMPEGYGFPIAEELWVPRVGGAGGAGPGAYAPREGPPITVFGRLAPGASLEDARVELGVVGEAMAASYPATHQHLRPRVAPWPSLWLGGALGGADPGGLSGIVMIVAGVASNVPLVLFLMLVCGNVALLMFARATSREGELVVRSALGASRSRIVAQLFVEALVLAGVATVIGLAAAAYAVDWLFRITETALLDGGRLPFWFEPGLSPTTLLYAVLLAVLAAAVAGILPGLKVTRDLRPGLQAASAGGGGFRFGGIWTAVLVLQIAVTMVFPVITIGVRSEASRELDEELALPADQYLSAKLDLERPADFALTADSAAAWVRSNLGPTAARLGERLRSEPRLRGVTFTERLPREYHRWRQVEVDGPTAEPMDERGHRLGSSRVAIDYFDVMGADIVAGRAFRLADLTEGQRVVVVNESFVSRVMGGRNPVGQRVRYLATEEYRNPEQDPGPWHQIVGVVEDLGTISGYGAAGIHHPADPRDIQPVRAVLQVAGDARSFGPTLRAIAADVDPALTLHDVLTLDELTRAQRQFYTFWSTILGALSGLALLLSMGGIFAVMSFTVARRTREIGIRVALGATRARVLASVFRRPLTQVVLGLAVGTWILWSLFTGLSDSAPDSRDLALLAGYVSVMGVLFLLACIPPTRRALAVEPAEALRVDG